MLRLIACAIVLTGGLCRAADHPSPVAGALHVLSIHVPDHATFNRVYALLHDVLELPVVYGTPSTGSNRVERVYAGFSVGNAYLEPCGPYATDGPFSADRPARFHGLTFTTGTEIDAVARELTARGFPHSGVMGGGNFPRFVYLSDPLLTSKFQAVSLWQLNDNNDRASLKSLRTLLDTTNGGGLGIIRLDEVRIGSPAKPCLKRWKTFVHPTPLRGKVCAMQNGPVLRFVPSDEVRLDSIVLAVRSRTKARSFLVSKAIPFRSRSNDLVLDGSSTCGLKIILRPQTVEKK